VPYELEAVIKGLVDKIERVQLTRGDHAALGHLEDRIAKLVEKLDASDARLNHLETIERGLAELLIHLEHHRVPNLAPAGFPPAEVEELTRDVADLRHTGKKTQESLELVHGTLGHVVDRLAMIETDMRSKPAQPAERRYAVETISAAPTDCAPANPAAPKKTAETAVEKTAERPAEKPGSPPSTPFAEGPQTIELTLREPSKPDQVPNIGRRPIDSSLPPDHPLEPGSSGSRRSHPGSPADRIAASESALVGIKPSVNPEPGGTSNFIAAARRAAQAAGRDPSVQSGASGPREIASAAGKLASRVGKLRALIAGTSAIVIVLGGLQIARTFLSSPQGTEADSQDGRSQVVVAAPAAVDGAVPPLSEPVSPSLVSPKPASSESATGRQSSAFPDGAGSPFPGFDIMIPPEIERQASGATNLQPARSAPAAPEREITGSISASAASVATKPTAAPASAASTPSTPAQPSGAALAPVSDRLPAAFGSSLRAAAAKGDAAAQFEIASRYAEGREVAQNLTEAVEWYERAAKQGLVPAQFRLGGLYEKGLGVKKNPETARRYYLAAGEAGNAKALHNLAVLYAEGIDGKPDYPTAAKWFRKAADYGIADSQYNLAILYARGIGVEQNLAEAYKWFALAARDGDADSAKKRDELGARLDRHSLTATAQAVQSWAPQRQPDAAVEVTPPPGGWDQAASSSSPIVPAKRKQPAVGPPKPDLATPQVVQ
jgi:localization factor PodJL